MTRPTTTTPATGGASEVRSPTEHDPRAEFLRHQPAMWRLTGRFFRQQADREDALQDALLAAVRGLAGFEGRCRMGTWLHRLTVNACLMKLRADGRRERREREARAADDDPPAAALTPIDALHQSELSDAVAAAAEGLAEDFRTVLELRQAGNSVAACAALLGISPDLVKVRCHRARAVLRQQLHHLAG